MSRSKKISINVSNNLLTDIDGVVRDRNTTRSQIIREAMDFYLRELRHRDMLESMRVGYKEMGEINLQLAREAFVIENEADPTYERRMGGVRTE